MNNQEMAKKVTELMAEGKSLAEALEIVTAKATTTTGKVDRVALMNETEDLQALRRAIKVAFAKKSSAKGDKEKVARYEAEVKAGQEKFNAILAAAPVELKERIIYFRAHNEEVTKIISEFLQYKNDELLVKLNSYSKNKLKETLALVPVDTTIVDSYEELNTVEKTELKRRATSDQWAIKVLKMERLVRG